MTVMHRSDPLIEQAKSWTADGRRVALVTVIETWGSSPCPTGSRMIVNDKAAFEGSVSGGCIETSVVSETLEILNEGGAQVLEYGVSEEMSFEAGLACGGTVRVLAEPLDAALLGELAGARPAVRVVDLMSGGWAVVRGDAVAGELAPPDDVLDAARSALADERPRTVESGDRGYFVDPVLPNYRLLVVGAVRIAQALAPMAVEAGFDVTVIDPRRAFATDARFPEVELVGEWPDKALAELGVDPHTAVVALTHDAEPDDMALGLAVRSKAFYVGALGSRRTHAKRLERLRGAGYEESELERIHAPVGLDIGARTPAEIAVSILAQVIAAKNGRGGEA